MALIGLSSASSTRAPRAAGSGAGAAAMRSSGELSTGAWPSAASTRAAREAGRSGLIRYPA